MTAKKMTKKEAEKTILNLFANAQKTQDTTEATRFVQKARTLAMKYRLKIPTQLKRKYCSHCHTFFIPGKNYRVRTHEGKIVYTCFTCKKYMRFVYK